MTNTSPRTIAGVRYGKSYEHVLTKEFLEENYIQKNISPYKIAKIVGCSPRTVYTYLDYYQIERIDRMATKQLQSGQRFNCLTTIEVIGKTKNGTHKWLCKCDCGNTTEVPTSALKNGSIKSCGCQQHPTGQNSHNYKGYCDITGKRMSEIRYRAKTKGMDYDLDAEFLWKLYAQQNKRCILSGLPLVLNKNASLDRIDSSGGYTKDNVQWVHVVVNKMKIDLKQEEFIAMAKTIAKHNGGLSNDDADI